METNVGEMDATVSQITERQNKINYSLLSIEFS